MAKLMLQKQTDNRHFGYAYNGINRLNSALNGGSYLQGAERHLSDVVYHSVEGWLQLREMPYPQYVAPYYMIEYFRSNAPKWLADFHHHTTVLWTFCEDKFTGSMFFDETEVTLNAMQFKVLLQTFLHNAIVLYQVMERSALDVEYVATAEELTLSNWDDPRRTS